MSKDIFDGLIGQDNVKKKLSFYLKAFNKTSICPFLNFVGAKGLTKPVKFVKFATLIFKQFAVPMEKTNALRYDKDVNFTGQDILNFWTDK